MTAQQIRSPEPLHLIREPSLRRLLGAAIVGGIGASLFSVAVAGAFVGSKAELAGASAADAGPIVAAVPWIVLAGVVHVLLAAALAAGREVVRTVAAVVTGLTAVAAATAAAMTAAGVDPFGLSGSGHPSSSGVGILAVAAVLYGATTLLAGGSAEA